MAKSIEEKIEDIAKQQLERFGVKYHIKTDNINEEINHALTTEKSKSGGEGGNYPDIKCLIQLPQSLSYIPVMIEVPFIAAALNPSPNSIPRTPGMANIA